MDLKSKQKGYVHKKSNNKMSRVLKIEKGWQDKCSLYTYAILDKYLALYSQKHLKKNWKLESFKQNWKKNLITFFVVLWDNICIWKSYWKFEQFTFS